MVARIIRNPESRSPYTQREIDELVASQMATMTPDKRTSHGEPEPVKRRRNSANIRADYARSPHGANCPLVKLVMRGEGGFSRGLMEADAYLRSHPECDPCSAWQSADGQTVRVTFGNGETMQFPRNAPKDSSKSRRDAARACRLAIFALLERRGPMTGVEIAVALSREPEYIRVAIRGSGGWFVRVALTKDSAYRVTPKAVKEYAAMNVGKPLAGGKAKGRRKAKVMA